MVLSAATTWRWSPHLHRRRPRVRTRIFVGTMNWLSASEPKRPGTPSWRLTRPASIPTLPRPSATSSPLKPHGSPRPKKPSVPPKKRRGWQRKRKSRSKRPGSRLPLRPKPPKTNDWLQRKSGERPRKRKKQIEETRLAATAQAKAAEDERLAAEKVRREAEKAKKPEETKVASAEPAGPKEDRPNADKPVDPAVAVLTPPGQVAPEVPKADHPALQDIARLLQSELKRVGCKTGEIDGEWNASARRALSSFNDKAGTKFDVKLASLDALDAVRARTGRVCPLDCERGFRADGDRCVKITCDDGYVLGSNGSCQKRPERTPRVTQREHHAPASSRRRCFSYNGASFCE